jgi:prolyl oligopeptidase
LVIAASACGAGKHEAATPVVEQTVATSAPDAAPVAPPTPVSPWKYPVTKTVDAADAYFGHTYRDPYRWLEDLANPEVEAWFKAQATLTDETLAKIAARDALADEWMQLDKLAPARFSGIHVERGRVFYKKTLGGENVGKLYYRDSWRGAEELLLDPSTVTPTGAKPGAVATINSFIASPDGKRVLLLLTAGGAEWSELRVLDVASRKLLVDSIYPVAWFGASWTPDSTSVFYSGGKPDVKAADIELDRQARIHKLGTPNTSDVDLLSTASTPGLGITPKEIPLAYVDEANPAYVVAPITTVQTEMNAFYAPAAGLKSSKLAWKVLCKPSDQLVRGLRVYNGKVYAVTHRDATHYKVVRTAIDKPDWDHAEVVIPEADDSIKSIATSKNQLFVVYSNGVRGRVVKRDLDTGKTIELTLPAGGTANVSCPDFRSNRCIVTTTSWTQPPALWDYDADKNTFVKSVFDVTVAYPGFDQLVVEEVEAPSHDGTMVPLSIVHRKDLKLDGSSSAILTGYGAYGISATPAFSVLTSSTALHHVVMAIAHPRGGSEKGEAWYRAGYKTTKPNTWKDFIACAEYLVKNGYTSAEKLGGTGTSAGGILISRAVTERPDLFAAAICNVGLCNAMRAEFSPNGPVNTPEFGTVKDETEAAALYEMDGMQHVKTGVKYPAILGVAGWNDPRVVPWEPGKFVAAVQAASSSGKPVFLKVNYDNGHFTEEKLVTFKNFATQYAFLLWQTGHAEFQPRP